MTFRAWEGPTTIGLLIASLVLRDRQMRGWSDMTAILALALVIVAFGRQRT